MGVVYILRNLNEGCIPNFDIENLKRIDRFRDVGVDGSII
jgi:hypothetical protein